MKLTVYLLKDIESKNALSKIASLIDKSFLWDERMMKMHKKVSYKPYTFNSLYPIEKDQIYRAGKVYTILIRSISKDFVHFCKEHLVNTYTEEMKALALTVKVLPQKMIQRIYSVTPNIIKCDQGYWKGHLTIQQYEKRLIDNLMKKYKYFIEEEINEDFELFTYVRLENRKPISFSYKNVKLLGDKVTIHIAENEMAQKLAYLALGCSLGELGARGAGFMSYQTM